MLVFLTLYFSAVRTILVLSSVVLAFFYLQVAAFSINVQLNSVFQALQVALTKYSKGFLQIYIFGLF